eukprot:Sspe_Gene.114053::Locus_99141_Transcript_1_1_Confidence_1.000_Length_2521::g.114053::m.114053/K15271/HFM1, MER3; ATP-dependent DNA helicase HFM1/MER3
MEKPPPGDDTSRGRLQKLGLLSKLRGQLPLALRSAAQPELRCSPAPTAPADGKWSGATADIPGREGTMPEDGQGRELEVASVLPPNLAQALPYKRFNRVQSSCFDLLFNTDTNAVIAAPTGSGKTVLMELAIMRLWLEKKEFKAVYVTPIKALAQEKVDTWVERFGKLGLSVVELTGDSGGDMEQDVNAMVNANIIVTTPEKWDSVTRRWRDGMMLSSMRDVGLMLLDEIHTLSEERGAVLEALVSRMKTIRSAHGVIKGESCAGRLRFVAVSATIPNVEDLAKWLDVPPEGMVQFSENDRPVPLEIRVVGWEARGKAAVNPYLFERTLTYKVPSVIVEYSDGLPTLVFCHTRKAAAATALYLAKELKLPRQGVDVSHLKNRQLADVVPQGVAFHHAGLQLSDRRFVERLFSDQALSVLCTTSTLALGVNLPAHLVIVKGTSYYHNGRTEDMPRGILLQMCGRAGRPGLDTHGKAVIMTSRAMRASYEQKLRGDHQALESNLHRHMIEHINAEIALGTINKEELVREWLRTTFFWIRVHQKPNHYGFQPDATEGLEMVVTGICESMVKELETYKCVERGRDGRLSSTRIGRHMARFYISFGTVKVFTESISPSMQLHDVLEMASRAEDFDDIRIRQGERKPLNALNALVRFGVADASKRKKVSEPHHKVSILTQCALQELPIEDWSLKNDQGRVINVLPRVLRCFTEFATDKGMYSAVKQSMVLNRCLARKMWDNEMYLLKQVDGIRSGAAQDLMNMGVRTVKDLAHAEAPKIEALAGRPPPFGITVKDVCTNIAAYNLSVTSGEGNGVLEATACLVGTPPRAGRQ